MKASLLQSRWRIHHSGGEGNVVGGEGQFADSLSGWFGLSGRFGLSGLFRSQPNEPNKLNKPKKPHGPDPRHAPRNGYGRLSISCGSSRGVKSSNGPISPTGVRVARRLQGTQKVENVLLLIVPERTEVLDHFVRFGCVEGKETPAAMRPNRLSQVRRSSVMQEEHTLAHTPQRGSSELLRKYQPTK